MTSPWNIPPCTDPAQWPVWAALKAEGAAALKAKEYSQARAHFVKAASMCDLSIQLVAHDPTNPQIGCGKELWTIRDEAKAQGNPFGNLPDELVLLVADRLHIIQPTRYPNPERAVALSNAAATGIARADDCIRQWSVDVEAGEQCDDPSRIIKFVNFLTKDVLALARSAHECDSTYLKPLHRQARAMQIMGEIRAGMPAPGATKGWSEVMEHHQQCADTLTQTYNLWSGTGT
jgi:hypothetical protein